MPPSRKPEGAPSPLTFFATELRRRREQIGWSQGQLGRQITYSIGLISMIETAQRTPSLDFVQRCDQALNAEGALTRIWPLLAYGVFPPRFRPWIDVERNAETLRSWDPLLIPGLLQTPGYARAVLEADPGVTDERVEELLTARLERQKLLAGETLLWSMIDEGVLHRDVGGPGIMRDQLAALQTASERRQVSVQIVPARAAVTAGLEGAFVIAGVEGSLDSVFVESATVGHVTDHPRDVAMICRRYETIRSAALPVRASADLIAKVMTQWQQT
ncbi:helix-turn-helix domain-containing protein [Streptosporangium carneum]|uniref:Transcriptional regulator n=1 Tax=Streptosporangium carneum TaxID=47481 RepID=A0A9W6I1D5_9ACTN|nr:helix-turn-helix transcriptional regulator [Streptosporangium carneum]GLK10230.1 transcriptional regulator [Streptosporangium carneum]